MLSQEYKEKKGKKLFCEKTFFEEPTSCKQAISEDFLISMPRMGLPVFV